jgi:GntR family transcriptional regulator
VQLAINPNTIAKAFQILQSEGVCEALRGRGLAIRSDAVAACDRARRTLLEERLRSAIGEALHGGLSTKEVRRLMLDQLGLLDGNVATVASPIDASSDDFEST